MIGLPRKWQLFMHCIIILDPKHRVLRYGLVSFYVTVLLFNVYLFQQMLIHLLVTVHLTGIFSIVLPLLWWKQPLFCHCLTIISFMSMIGGHRHRGAAYGTI